MNFIFFIYDNNKKIKFKLFIKKRLFFNKNKQLI